IWESGTAFGDGNHTISIADKSCDLGPTLADYRIKEGTKLFSTVNSAFLSKRSFNVNILSKSDEVHMLPQNGSKGKEVCSVKFDFRGLKIDVSGGRLEMRGTCTYEILLYYQRNGKEKPHYKKKEDGVAVLFTAPWTPEPTITEPPSSDLASDDELDSRRKECQMLAADHIAARDDGTASESKAKVIGELSATIRGKTFSVEIYEWDSDGGHYDAMNGKARIYVPPSSGSLSPNFDFPGYFANEIGHFIMDAGDGVIDGASVGLDGSSISSFDAELLSDQFSRDLLRYVLGKGGRNPFEAYNFQSPPSFRPGGLLLSGEIRSRGPFSLWSHLPISWQETAAYGGAGGLPAALRRYERRIELFEQAKMLAAEGKTSEGYDLLKSKGYDNYACKLLDYADELKAKANEQNMEPPAFR
ncbi:MAG: hypothetical protein RIS70_623, partial [Planctomycetota bacterium]